MIQKTNIDALHKEGKSQKVITESRGGFSELGAPGKYRNCTHLPRSTVMFLFCRDAYAQWCPIVVSNVSTFCMYMLKWDSFIYIYIYSCSRLFFSFML